MHAPQSIENVTAYIIKIRVDLFLVEVTKQGIFSFRFAEQLLYITMFLPSLIRAEWDAIDETTHQNARQAPPRPSSKTIKWRNLSALLQLPTTICSGLQGSAICLQYRRAAAAEIFAFTPVECEGNDTCAAFPE